MWPTLSKKKLYTTGIGNTATAIGVKMIAFDYTMASVHFAAK
jgi:hypothetical protein